MLRNPLCRLFGTMLFIAILVTAAWAASSTTNQVTWTDVVGETSYDLMVSFNGGGYSLVVNVPADTVSHNHANQALGQYCYQIVAKNSFGPAAGSTPACVLANVPGQVVGVQVLATANP